MSGWPRVARAACRSVQITAAPFVVQYVLMASFVWIMGLSVRVPRGQRLPLLFRALLLFVFTWSTTEGSPRSS